VSVVIFRSQEGPASREVLGDSGMKDINCNLLFQFGLNWGDFMH